MRGRVAATVDSPAWDADGSCRAGDVTVQATRVTAQTAASIQRMAGRAPRPFPGDMIPSNRSASTRFPPEKPVERAEPRHFCSTFSKTIP